jgi:hypothetical protein
MIDLRGIAYLAIFGFISLIACIVALLVAIVTYFLGYWSFGITI